MKVIGIILGVAAALVTFISPTTGHASTRARSRAETILNDSSVRGLAKQTGNERFAQDSYRRLLQMFGGTVVVMKKFDPEEALRLIQALVTTGVKKIVFASSASGSLVPSVSMSSDST